jgi:hypothetical protein
MSKDLTTRERNEIIGLAIDYDSDSYNHILDFMYDRNFCNGNKSDCRILAAIVAVSKIDKIETVEKYDIAESDLGNAEYQTWYRWGRIVAEYSSNPDETWGEINLWENDTKAQENFAELSMIE